MNKRIDELDVVALIHDRRDLELVAGQVGTVVEILEEGVFEVEFNDDQGRTYAMATLKKEELMVLHYSQVAA